MTEQVIQNPFPLEMEELPTPCFVVDEGVLGKNLSVLQSVQDRTGCKILLALKGFALFHVFPLLADVLKGTCASSPHEAQLGREEFGGEVHVFAPAYSVSDMEILIHLCDHIVFNSFSQWKAFQPMLRQAKSAIQCGLRINPEHSEAEVALYDPCAKGSRLGIRREVFEGQDLEGISGLHFHTLCEQNADALERTLNVVEQKFGPLIKQMQWMNFGGGHHITRADYDVDKLCNLIVPFQEKYEVQVYLEPGEAVALNAGVLVTSVLDLVHNGMDIAILDTSATAHMPDVLEMPYRPQIVGGADPGVYAHTYRLAGLSCLAGDVIGDYSFKEPLRIGSKLVFLDMAHYTMVKTTTFNGVQLPYIALREKQGGRVRVVREFGYEDYKNRLS